MREARGREVRLLYGGGMGPGVGAGCGHSDVTALFLVLPVVDAVGHAATTRAPYGKVTTKTGRLTIHHTLGVRGPVHRSKPLGAGLAVHTHDECRIPSQILDGLELCDPLLDAGEHVGTLEEARAPQAEEEPGVS